MKKRNNCSLQKRKARGEGDRYQYAENKIRVSIWCWSLSWLIAGLLLVIFKHSVRERSQLVDRSPAEDNKLYRLDHFSWTKGITRTIGKIDQLSNRARTLLSSSARFPKITFLHLIRPSIDNLEYSRVRHQFTDKTRAGYAGASSYMIVRVYRTEVDIESVFVVRKIKLYNLYPISYS